MTLVPFPGICVLPHQSPALLPHLCTPAGSRSLALCMSIRADAREAPCLCLSPCRINKPSPLHGFEGSTMSGASSPAGPGQSMFSRAGTRRRLILGEGTQHSSVAFASSRQGSAEIQLVSLMVSCQAPVCSVSYNEAAGGVSPTSWA